MINFRRTPFVAMATLAFAIALMGCEDERQRLERVVRDEIAWCAQELSDKQVKSKVDAAVEASWSEKEGASVSAKVIFSLEKMTADTVIRRFLYQKGLTFQEAAQKLQECATPKIKQYLSVSSRQAQETFDVATAEVAAYIDDLS